MLTNRDAKIFSQCFDVNCMKKALIFCIDQFSSFSYLTTLAWRLKGSKQLISWNSFANRSLGIARDRTADFFAFGAKTLNPQTTSALIKFDIANR